MANTDVLLMLSGPTNNSGAGLNTLIGSETDNVSTVWGPSARGAMLVSAVGTLCPGVEVVLITTDEAQGTYLSDAGSNYDYELILRSSSNGTHFLLEKWNTSLGYFEVVTNAPFSTMPSVWVFHLTQRITKVGDSTKWVQARAVVRVTKALVPTSDSVRVRTEVYRARAADGAIDPTRAIGVVSAFAPAVAGLASWHADAHFYEGGFDCIMAHGIDFASVSIDGTAKTVTIYVRCYAPGYVYGEIVQYSSVVDYNTEYQQFVFVGRPDRFSGALFYVDTVKMRLSAITSTLTYQLGLWDSKAYYAPTLRNANYANRLCYLTYYLYNRTNSTATVTARLISGLDSTGLKGSASKLSISDSSTTDPALTGALARTLDVTGAAKTFQIPALSYKKMAFVCNLTTPTPADGTSATVSFEVKS